MKVAVVRETTPHERRVALVPELVGRLTAAGFEVDVEIDAGAHAGYSDQDYRAAGATVSADPFPDADAVLSVQPLPTTRARELPIDVVTISFLPIARHTDLVKTLRDAKVTSLAMELVPRISRAQSMDALSSQAMVAGYRAAIVAAERLPRFFPLFMTAAGTVPPAKVLVLGAGVAGLQAIATARRLGAQVSAYDVRASAAEEVRSMGAQFVDLDLPTLEGAGGYAREMTEERSRLQRERLAGHVVAADVLITTAAVPGRSAPLLVERPAIEAMRAGSVVVDLAAESGGNVEGSVAGEEIQVGGATVIGPLNIVSDIPAQASRLYGSNVVELLTLVASGGRLDPDFDDEIIDATCVTHAGQVRNEAARAAVEET